jgi:uncharacterized protein (UPF0261 family)
LATFFFAHFPCEASKAIIGKILFVYDRKGGPFHDPERPEFFGKTLKKYLQPGISLHFLPHHINDPEFSVAVIESLEQVLKMKAKPNE